MTTMLLTQTEDIIIVNKFLVNYIEHIIGNYL
jgi:hypothetical protein